MYGWMLCRGIEILVIIDTDHPSFHVCPIFHFNDIQNHAKTSQNMHISNLHAALKRTYSHISPRCNREL